MTSFSYHTFPTMKVRLYVKVPAVLKQPCFIVTHSNCRVGPNVKMSVLSKTVNSGGTVLCFLSEHKLLCSIWELNLIFYVMLNVLFLHAFNKKLELLTLLAYLPHAVRCTQTSPSLLVLEVTHLTH